jgi:D-serine deaminase-like pyridoxal phosphate-dependent protein
LDDFLVAYPTVQSFDLEFAWQLTNDGKKIQLTVDSEVQVKLLDKFWNEKAKAENILNPPKLLVCIDIDMSYRALGGALHLGTHR